MKNRITILCKTLTVLQIAAVIVILIDLFYNTYTTTHIIAGVIVFNTAFVNSIIIKNI